MYQGKQCSACLRHSHEDFYDKENSKRWVIDRCAYCKHPFNLTEFAGSATFFTQQYKKSHTTHDVTHDQEHEVTPRT